MENDTDICAIICLTSVLSLVIFAHCVLVLAVNVVTSALGILYGFAGVAKHFVSAEAVE